MCLELVKGEALGMYLAKSDEAQCLEVLRELARALDQLDQIEMRHGDLTLENVLVRGRTPVLTDPDSSGKASGGKRYSGSDFEPFAAIVRGSKVAVTFPDITSALGRLDSSIRPFVAAAEILTDQLRPVLARQPSMRLREARDTYRNESAILEGRYANVLRLRRASFNELISVVSEDCAFVGLELDPPMREEEEKEAAEEMALISKPAGLLRACTRRFRSRGGHRWTLELLSRSGVRVAMPFPDPSVRGEMSSAVHTLDDIALIEERLRVRVDLSGRASWELGTVEGWAPLPEDWQARLIEILAGRRVPALPTGHIVQLSLGASGSERSANDVAAALTAQLKQRNSSALAVGLDALASSSRAAWPETLGALFRETFLPEFGPGLRNVGRFDLAIFDGCWHLDIAAHTRMDQSLASWIVPLPWLPVTERELHA
jgi:hypothetical protein